MTNSNDQMIAEVFPPGDYIRAELEARGWTQQDLADILGKPLMSVNMVITGKRSVSPDMAKLLGEAFGTSAELWINLESSYQLWKAKQASPDIARRANLYAYAPINEMARRGWIELSDSIEVMENQLCRFFRVPSLNDRPKYKAAAKKSSYDAITHAEDAWYARAQSLGRAVPAKPFKHDRFVENFPSIRTLIGDPENVRHVPKILAEWGIRFVAVEPIQKLAIDGAAIWMDEDVKSPLIVTSLRFDRLDYFWFVLVHEMIHIKYKDPSTVDLDLFPDPKDNAKTPSELPAMEVRTNNETANFLIPQEELNTFIQRVKPLYSKVKIIQFANRMKINPGIVVGQLQRRGEIPYSHSREMLAQGRIRKEIASTAIVDGFGCTPGPLENK